MQATLFAQTKLTYFSYAHPTKGGSTFALSMTQLASTGFEQVDVTVNPANQEPSAITASGSFADQQQAMAFSWGKNVTDTVSFGMGLKQVTASYWKDCKRRARERRSGPCRLAASPTQLQPLLRSPQRQKNKGDTSCPDSL